MLLGIYKYHLPTLHPGFHSLSSLLFIHSSPRSYLSLFTVRLSFVISSFLDICRRTTSLLAYPSFIPSTRTNLQSCSTHSLLSYPSWPLLLLAQSSSLTGIQSHLLLSVRSLQFLEDSKVPISQAAGKSRLSTSRSTFPSSTQIPTCQAHIWNKV